MAHSDSTEVITGVPQGSILGPLLFNIFLNDIFMFISKCNLCNYADDKTLYSTGKDLNRIRRNLEMDFMMLHQWFHLNHMTLNPGNRAVATNSGLGEPGSNLDFFCIVRTKAM